MSIKIMSDVWAHGPEQAGELMVLLVLADYANDDGECWPAVTSVAQKARITDRSARRILRNLEEKGFIQTRENRGRNYTNLYLINLEALKPDNLSAPQENRTSEAENRTFTTVKPDTVSPEPSLTIKEPSEDPLVSPKRKQGKRAVALPECWVPSEKNLQDAYERDFTDEEINHEAHQFRDHHLARGTTFKDWNAAWRTWLGNARKFGNRRVARQAGPRGYGQGGGIAGAVARRQFGG